MALARRVGDDRDVALLLSALSALTALRRRARQVHFSSEPPLSEGTGEKGTELPQKKKKP
jgi:hypothetical protein